MQELTPEALEKYIEYKRSQFPEEWQATAENFARVYGSAVIMAVKHRINRYRNSGVIPPDAQVFLEDILYPTLRELLLIQEKL